MDYSYASFRSSDGGLILVDEILGYGALGKGAIKFIGHNILSDLLGSPRETGTFFALPEDLRITYAHGRIR